MNGNIIITAKLQASEVLTQRHTEANLSAAVRLMSSFLTSEGGFNYAVAVTTSLWEPS